MIGLNVKKMFFTSKAVLSVTDRATRRVLSKFGAYVRRTAKSSIRQRKAISSPGSPPSSHTGLLKRFILFGYDPSKRSVVIGPLRLTRGGRGDAPRALEEGGTTQVVRRGRKKRVKIKARPFMGPAMEKEKPKLPQMWRNSVSS